MSFIVELLDRAALLWKSLTTFAQEHYLVAKIPASVTHHEMEAQIDSLQCTKLLVHSPRHQHGCVFTVQHIGSLNQTTAHQGKVSTPSARGAAPPSN